MSFYGKFSPVAKNGVPDYKRDSEKWFNWLDEQEYYILNGFQVGGDKISGRLYHKLNFTQILHLGNDGYEYPIYPYYVDAQREFYDLLEWCYEHERDIIFGKGRDKGFSYDIANLALYETHYHPYTSVAALFPSGQSKAKAKFLEKYNLSWNSLPEDMKYYPDLSDSKNILSYGWQSTNEEGQKGDEGAMSSLTMIEVVNADVAKSGRFKAIYIEEFGEIKKPLSLIATNKANMRKGAKKFGITIAGGTSNAFNEGYEDFRELWYNHDAFGFEKFFVPAQKMYWGYVNYETGVSDEEGAKQHIEAGRAKLKGEQLMIDMQNYPIEEKQMFIQIKASPFDSYKCSNQIDKILTDKTMQNAVEIGNLFLSKKENGELDVQFRIMPNGRWKIAKHPKKNLLTPDVGGVDSFRLGKVEESDSKGAIVIYRGFQGISEIGNMPICTYWNRPTDKDDFFMDCYMTAIYYGCKLLIEYTDEDIMKYFLERKALKYLKERPRLIQSPFSKATYTYGVKPTEYNKAAALEYCIKEFNQHYEDILFVQLLDELANFGVMNTDLADAYLWAVLHAMDNVRFLVEYKQEKKKPFMPYMAVNGVGEMVVVNSPSIQERYNGIFQGGQKRQ